MLPTHTLYNIWWDGVCKTGTQALSHFQVPIFQLVPLIRACLLALSTFLQHIPVPLGSLTPWIPVRSSHTLPSLLKSSPTLPCTRMVYHWRSRIPWRPCHFLVLTMLLAPLSSLISGNHCLTQADVTETGTCLVPVWIPVRKCSSS